MRLVLILIVHCTVQYIEIIAYLSLFGGFECLFGGFGFSPNLDGKSSVPVWWLIFQCLYAGHKLSAYIFSVHKMNMYVCQPSVSTTLNNSQRRQSCKLGFSREVSSEVFSQNFTRIRVFFYLTFIHSHAIYLVKKVSTLYIYHRQFYYYMWIKKATLFRKFNF